MGQHETRHAIRQRGLADTALAADQPGVRNPSGAVGVEQCLLGVGVAEQHCRLARRGYGAVASILRHIQTAASSNSMGAVAGSRRLATTRQICSATSSLAMVASISTQR